MVATKKYTPERGDIVLLTFNPQSGHEQKGRRPALVVSNELFNKKMGFALACPITNTDRAVPFHVPLPPTTKTTGFIMAEQIKSLDIFTRKVSFVEKAPDETVQMVISIVSAIMQA